MNILDDYKGLPFGFHTFDVRRSIDVLDPKNLPESGSRAYRGHFYLQTPKLLIQKRMHLKSSKTSFNRIPNLGSNLDPKP